MTGHDDKTQPDVDLGFQASGILPHERLGLSTEKVTAALRGMMLVREVDDRLWLMARQGKVHFVITSAGHEAAQFGCAWALNVGHDYVVPYYRDIAPAMAMGQKPLDMMLYSPGQPDDPAHQGRQMVW